jgi:ABC-type oligopeptide transport system substrate-binding subunit
MMRRYNRWFAWIALFALAGSLTLTSCKALRGDPRKNCNHPKHGDYMREQQQKNFGKSGA